MKVYELIEQLKTFNPEIDVVISTDPSESSEGYCHINDLAKAQFPRELAVISPE